MATPFDAGIQFLALFKPIFVWLLVFGVTYIISKMVFKEMLGDTWHVPAISGLVFATLFIMTPGLSDVVAIALPWLTVFIMALLFLMFIFIFGGVAKGTITKNIFSEPAYIWIILIVVLLIFGFALSQVYGPAIQNLTAEEASAQGVSFDIGKVLFSPKLLGMLLLLAIASQTVRLVVKSQ